MRGAKRELSRKTEGNFEARGAKREVSHPDALTYISSKLDIRLDIYVTGKEGLDKAFRW